MGIDEFYNAIETMFAQTATLIIRLPESVEVSAGSYAIRNKSALLRTLLVAFRDMRLEFLYAGPRLLTNPPTEPGTTFIINVLQADDRLLDTNIPRDILLKRFEKEVRYNPEYIIIDSGLEKRRLIEIYINNRSIYS